MISLCLFKIKNFVHEPYKVHKISTHVSCQKILCGTLLEVYSKIERVTIILYIRELQIFWQKINNSGIFPDCYRKIDIHTLKHKDAERSVTFLV